MNPGRVLAIANIALALAACVGYLWAGDIRRAVYWGAAAALTSSVTF